MSFERPKGFLEDTLGMEELEAPVGESIFRMKVDRKVCQHLGILSGATSLAMAEWTAGYGSCRILAADPTQVSEDGKSLLTFPYGLQVSANHLHMAKEGDTVTAHGICLSHGKTVHVWNVDITDSEGNLISTARVVNLLKRVHAK